MADSDQKKQIAAGKSITRALTFLRSTARTNDYFTGYSLNEIIQERIDLIGKEEDKRDEKVGTSSKLTLLSQLNSLLYELVGESPKHEEGAINAALKLESIEDLVDAEQEYEDEPLESEV